MEADNFTLARLLALAALIAATIEYAETIKRRITLRAAAAERATFEERGLRGLVRVFLADPSPDVTDLPQPGGTADLGGGATLAT